MPFVLGLCSGILFMLLVNFFAPSFYRARIRELRAEICKLKKENTNG